MSKQMWNWFIAAGALVSFVGLLFLPSALNSQNRDESMLGAGLAIFSLGALMIAVAFYFKTKALRGEIGSEPNRAALLNGKRRRITCDSCHQAAPVIQCTMHKMSLCSNCLSQHYDSRACVYVPAIRKSAGRVAKGASAARV
ncbi:MAG: hypothetical protein DMG70_16365 [Acidobacteria bacterium]|nr:MAG: hypothetical protein DMG70_16365 [Acidobacteriota bacterium]PYY05572.1 MAG: hypothetical protein DMG69_26295 [Acidobacteriota bacterium]